jgi:hypothetical protein
MMTTPASLRFANTTARRTRWCREGLAQGERALEIYATQLVVGVARDSELVAHLVAEGIDCLSLNPDSQLKTMLAIVDLENRLAQGTPETASVGTQAAR